jgi:hypothetical protein
VVIEKATIRSLVGMNVIMAQFNPVVGSGMFGRVGSRHVVPFALLAALLCLAYFYLVDRVIFSTAVFAPIFKFLLTTYDAQTAWLALGVCIIAAAWRKPAPILRVVDALAAHPRAVILGCVVAFALGSLWIYHNTAVCMDEYAAVFQSKIFAAGRLYAQLPASGVDWLVVRGFNGAFLYASRETGRAIEGYWPGFALLLAPFQVLGIPWLCNPLLAALAIYLVFRITLEITRDRRAAGWAILFTLASVAFVAYAISYYSMQAHLTVNLLFAYLLLRPTPSRSFAAGLAGSLALVLHNPFPHALFAAPWLLSMLADERQRRHLGPLLLGYLPGLCVGASWLTLRAGFLPTHTVASVGWLGGIFVWPDVGLFNMRAASTIKLWLWASPGLFLLAAVGVRRYGDNPHVRLLAYSAALTFVGYFFVRFDQGHGWGYRYFHSAWGCIPILAGVAMANRTDAARSRLVTFAGAAAVLSLLVIVPFQMHQIEGFIAQHLAQVPAPKRPGGNVFFLNPRGGFYLADMIQIDPLLRGPDLLLASRGAPLDAQLMRQNWPDARHIAGGVWGEQWYVAPSVQSGSGEAREKPTMRFDFHESGRPD